MLPPDGLRAKITVDEWFKAKSPEERVERWGHLVQEV